MQLSFPQPVMRTGAEKRPTNDNEQMVQMFTPPARTAGLVLAGALAACTSAPETETTRLDLGDEVIITDFTLGPPDARPGACYGKDVTPAVIEQVTERVRDWLG